MKLSTVLTHSFRLIPTLKRLATRDLIYTIAQLCSKPTFDNASECFRLILEELPEKLALRVSDFPRDSVFEEVEFEESESEEDALEEDGSESYESESNESNESNTSDTFDYPEKFNTLIDNGFSMGLTAWTTELIGASCAAIHSAVPKPNSGTILSYSAVQSFLTSLTSTLVNHKIPFNEMYFESVGDMYAVLLRRCVLAVPKSGTEFDVRLLKSRVRFLRRNYVQMLLGYERYRKLVELEGIPDFCEAEQHESRKREPDEELEGSIPSRPKLIE